MKYQVWCPDNGDTESDSRTFEAFDAELAAAYWAHWHDDYTADYTIVGGTDATVCVRDETCLRGLERIDAFGQHRSCEGNRNPHSGVLTKGFFVTCGSKCYECFRSKVWR